MTDDREARVREHAHRLWEQEGRPEGRHEAHWHAAERAVPRGGANSAVEGAGSDTAARAYDQATHRFAASGKVTQAARDAAQALAGAEAPALPAGDKARARDEDPAPKRRATRGG